MREFGGDKGGIGHTVAMAMQYEREKAVLASHCSRGDAKGKGRSRFAKDILEDDLVT